MRRHDTEHTESTPMHRWVQSVVGGGTVAGLAGAAVIAAMRIGIVLILLLVSLTLTRSWNAGLTRLVRRQLWTPLKVAAFPLVGDRVFDAGFDPRVVFLGLFTLFGFSIFTGVLFAVLARGRSHRVTVVLGLLFGVAAWIVDLRLVNPSLATAIEVVPSGLAMAYAFLWHERRLPRRR
jgi:hypothetical protein